MASNIRETQHSPTPSLKRKKDKKKKKSTKTKRTKVFTESDSENDSDIDKDRCIKKCHSYMKKGRLKKLEKIVSLFRKYRWNAILENEVNRTQTKEQGTYLHMFCSEGNSIMVNTLLELNADVSICDKSGNNFLHVAFNYILESFDRGFLSYITEKLLPRLNPNLMEERNRYGETPVDLLDEIVYVLQNKQAFQFVEIESETEHEIDEAKWTEKLFFEMGQEEAFSYEGFEQDEFSDTFKKMKSETFTEWGDRIWKEYNRKHNTQERQRPDARKQRRQQETPGISGHKEIPRQKGPTEYLKELRTNLVLLERREKYEEICHRLFKNPHETSELSMDDFPWSHFPQYGILDTGTFNEQSLVREMLETFTYGFTDEEKIKYLKVQRIRWHPDKFFQKCGHRIQAGCEKELILQLVKSISQSINSELSSFHENSNG